MAWRNTIWRRVAETLASPPFVGTVASENPERSPTRVIAMSSNCRMDWMAVEVLKARRPQMMTNFVQSRRATARRAVAYQCQQSANSEIPTELTSRRRFVVPRASRSKTYNQFRVTRTSFGPYLFCRLETWSSVRPVSTFVWRSLSGALSIASYNESSSDLLDSSAGEVVLQDRLSRRCYCSEKT